MKGSEGQASGPVSAGRVLEAQAWAVCKGLGERGCLFCVRGKNRILAWLNYNRRKDMGYREAGSVAGLNETPRSFRAFTVEIKMKDLSCSPGQAQAWGCFQSLLTLGPIWRLGPLCPGTRVLKKKLLPRTLLQITVHASPSQTVPNPSPTTSLFSVQGNLAPHL